MQPLIDSLEALKNECAREPAVLSKIDIEITAAEQWIAETLAEDGPPQSRPPRAFGNVDGHDQPLVQARSIFDDIDE